MKQFIVTFKKKILLKDGDADLDDQKDVALALSKQIKEDIFKGDLDITNSITEIDPVKPKLEFDVVAYVTIGVSKRIRDVDFPSDAIEQFGRDLDLSRLVDQIGNDVDGIDIVNPGHMPQGYLVETYLEDQDDDGRTYEDPIDSEFFCGHGVSVPFEQPPCECERQRR